MIFWRVLDNRLHSINNVERLGFDVSNPSYIPDEYLEKQEFVVMRTCHGLGDWGIVSALPRLLKEKYPNAEVGRITAEESQVDYWNVIKKGKLK